MTNITAFEYITAGGFRGKPLPSHLVSQAKLMIAQVLKDLLAVEGLKVRVVARDKRFFDFFKNMKVEMVARCPKEGLFLPIAPEWALERVVSQEAPKAGNGVECLSSSTEALKVACSKLATSDLFAPFPNTGWFVTKPAQGCGCEGVYRHQTKPAPEKRGANGKGNGKDFCQPWLEGEHLSALCLFSNGAARVLQTNRQELHIAPDGKVNLNAIICGIAPRGFASLASRVARRLPGLYGFCGLDGVRFKGKLYLIEINPRITSAYLGLSLARHNSYHNPMEWLLELRKSGLRASYPVPKRSVIKLC